MSDKHNQKDLLEVLNKRQVFNGLGNILTKLIAIATQQLELEEEEISELLEGDYWNDKRVMYLLKLVQTFKIINELSKEDELKTYDDELDLLDEDKEIIKSFIERAEKKKSEKVIDIHRK